MMDFTLRPRDALLVMEPGQDFWPYVSGDRDRAVLIAAQGKWRVTQETWIFRLARDSSLQQAPGPRPGWQHLSVVGREWRACPLDHDGVGIAEVTLQI